MENLSQTYDPQATEQKIYDFWEENQCFKADASSEAEHFSIVIPPPNVTGILHMGHAIDNTLQDILIRYNRMIGKATLWVPGTDHAGIATQNVVEKRLREEQGVSRFDLGREKFLDNVWEWANARRSDILDQFKKLGISPDWSRERFTLDEGCSQAVKEVFVRLYEKDLIYKGTYIVNWCPRCRSAISDVETEHKEEAGKLWEISYPLEKEYGALVVATTRPETLFGDVAVAVHPDDIRYKGLVGKNVVLPLTRRPIPIIADESVDKDFGTGAVKITPAHDPNDFEMAQRHNLKPIWVMDKDGKMCDNEYVHPDLRGKDRYEAREHALGLLKYQASLIRTKEHPHNVGHCQRCDTTIEPYLSEQWFVRMKPLAERPIAAVKTGELKFVPERWTKIYLDWMENIRDWCISRPLWWGHQIPAYHCQDCKNMMVSVDAPTQCTKCQSTNIEQETDVLDTWFSSALWPFSTMGWPDTEAPDFKKFYPTSTLVTAFDIIFFWVARMVVMGYEFTDQSPFNTVYIHGLIRDEHGKKMSKSTGNAIDPRVIIDKYGTDALRFTLTSLNTFGGQDIKLSDERFEYGRNFANKLWNASRFVIMNLEGVDNEPINKDALTLADKWILSHYNKAIQDVHEAIKTYHLGEYASLMYEFTWNVFCDWYVEIAKTQLNDPEKKANTQRVLLHVLNGILELLHPVMPHITEEIWQKLTIPREKLSIMHTVFPAVEEEMINETVNTQMENVMALISGVRNIRQSLNVSPGTRIDIIIESTSDADRASYEEAQPYIEMLARVKSVELKPELSDQPYAQSATAVIGTTKVIVPLAGVIDLDKELDRQKKKLEKLEKEQKALQGRLNNEKFVAQAPEKVVQEAKERLEEIDFQVKNIQELMTSLAG